MAGFGLIGCFQIIAIINKASITVHLLDYFLRQENWLCGVEFWAAASGYGRCVGRELPSLWLVYSTGPDFIANTSRLHGMLCIANIILTVYHVSISFMTSPRLPPCLSVSDILWPEVSFLLVSLIVWMLLPLAFHWALPDDFSVTQSEKRSAWSQSLMESQFIRTSGKVISVAPWDPSWK